MCRNGRRAPVLTGLAFAIAGVLALAGPALGDQTDARLDTLFAAIAEAGSAAEALPIENEIWSIWRETPDPAAAALMERGLEAMGRRDYDSAIATFDELVAIAPDFSEGWNMRATAYYQAGNYLSSLSDIQITLSLEPRHFGALSGLGQVRIQLDDLAGALQSFEAALEINPFLRGASVNARAIRKHLGQRDI